MAFLAPWALLGIPLAVGGLVYAYRKRAKGERVVVASVMLLRQLTQRAPRSFRFKPPFRFYIETALGVLLALAASGLSIEQSVERVAIVVDTSLSMAARVAPASDERFSDRAVSIVEGELGRASLLRKISVITASDMEGARNTSNLEERLRPSFTNDNLPALVAAIEARGNFDSVVLVTDRLSVGEAPPTMKVRSVRNATEQFDNIAIRGGKLAASSASTQSLRVDLFRSAGVAREPIVVTLQGLRGGRVVLERTATTSATEPSSVTFSALPAHPAWVASVSLAPATQNSRNLLREDDVWYFADVGAGGRIGVLSKRTLQQLGLSANLGWYFESLSGAAPLRIEDLEAQAISTVIVDKLALAVPPTVNALFVAPPGDSPLFAATAVIKAPAISNWMAAHPLLRYIKVPLISPSTTATLDLPPWAEVVVDTPLGPIVGAGDTATQRLVGVGFEIFPFDGDRSPALSIFTLNALRWLTERTSRSNDATLGQGVVLRADESLRDGQSEVQLSSDGRSATRRTPGLVWTLRNGTREHAYSTNFFDPEESGLASDLTLQSTSITSTRAHGAKPTSDWLMLAMVWLVLSVASCEWLILVLRRRSAK